MKNRYCEGCNHLTKKTGYCNKVSTKMTKEKQTGEFIRCVSCVGAGWKHEIR